MRGSAVSDKKRDEILAEKAKEAFTRCGNCAQASFAVLQDAFTLDIIHPKQLWAFPFYICLETAGA